MTQILVVKDVGLWISLNRYFAGGSGVRLSEASTLETGMRLARIERPDILVCSTESLEQDVGSLTEALRELPERIRILCVDRSADPGVPEVGHFMTCRPERFLDVAGLLVDSGRPRPRGVAVDLLAHFEIPCKNGEEPRRGFANLIEFGRGEILMESDEALEPKERLDLTFFVPDPAGGGAARRKIGLRCEIRLCRDEDRLLYVADFRATDEESEGALGRYIADRQRASGSDS